MARPSDINNRSELNEAMRKGTMDVRETLSSIIKDELFITDDTDFIDVCTIDGDSFVDTCDSDKLRTLSHISTIDCVYNDKKATNELKNKTEQCKTTKSFTCSKSSFKCCSKNNLEYHVQNYHKIQEKETAKSINNSPNERSLRMVRKIDKKKDIELYCAKCDLISSPRIIRKQLTCGLCKILLIYQCRICKKRYTHIDSLYRHLKHECINVEPQFKCSQCDYKSKQKAHLQRHVKLKHSIKKCTKCSKNFKDSFALRKHQRHKCSNKPMFKCYSCSYKAIFKTQLEEHIRLEHNSRYTCSQCGKKYMYLNSFDNHQKYFCGTELHFECDHCAFSTNYKHSLKQHIRCRHSEIFLFGDSL